MDHRKQFHDLRVLLEYSNCGNPPKAGWYISDKVRRIHTDSYSWAATPEHIRTMHTSPSDLDLGAIALRLRQAMAAVQPNGMEFAEKTGVPYSTMRSYLDKGRPPSSEFLAGMFRAYRIEPAWLLTGEGPMRRSDSAAPGLQAAAKPAKAHPGSLELLGAVPALTLKGIGVKPEDLENSSLMLIKIHGTGMQGVLSDGDRVLVDTSDRQPRSGYIYALKQVGEIIVRYCQLLPGGILRVTSANPVFAPYDVDLSRSNEVAVLGRVVTSLHDW